MLKILSKYLALIEDLDTRLTLASKFQCHKVAVEVSHFRAIISSFSSFSFSYISGINNDLNL